MIAEFESRILALIDDMVEHASDDELFASGYLRGHLTLAVAELEGRVTITLPEALTDAGHPQPGKSHSGRGTLSARPVAGAGHVGQPVYSSRLNVSSRLILPDWPGRSLAPRFML